MDFIVEFFAFTVELSFACGLLRGAAPTTTSHVLERQAARSQKAARHILEASQVVQSDWLASRRAAQTEAAHNPLVDWASL